MNIYHVTVIQGVDLGADLVVVGVLHPGHAAIGMGGLGTVVVGVVRVGGHQHLGAAIKPGAAGGFTGDVINLLQYLGIVPVGISQKCRGLPINVSRLRRPRLSYW